MKIMQNHDICMTCHDAKKTFLACNYLLVMPPSLQLGDEDFLRIIDDLFAHHDNRQLLSQFDQTTTVTAL